eukprot:gene30786-35826_t
MLPPLAGRPHLARFRGPTSSTTSLDTFEQAVAAPDTGRPASSMPPSSNNTPVWARTVSEFDIWGLREHVADLAGALTLVIIFFALDKAPPRRAFVATEMLHEYSMPYHGNTVPPHMVLFFSYILPLIVIVLVKVAWKGTWKDLYRTIVTLYFTVAIVGVITNCIKIMIGRPRPNFVYRCWEDGKPVFKDENIYGGWPLCGCELPVEIEHLKSFPSGHSSLSSAGLGFLTFFLLSQTKAFSGTCHPWRVFISLMPAVGAILIGVTRVMDYWHHPTDVIAGLTLGFSISFLMHQHLFPWFSHPESDSLSPRGNRAKEMSSNNAPLLMLDPQSVLASWDRMGSCFSEEDILFQEIDAAMALELSSYDDTGVRFQSGWEQGQKPVCPNAQGGMGLNDCNVRMAMVSQGPFDPAPLDFSNSMDPVPDKGFEEAGETCYGEDFFQLDSNSNSPPHVQMGGDMKSMFSGKMGEFGTLSGSSTSGSTCPENSLVKQESFFMSENESLNMENCIEVLGACIVPDVEIQAKPIPDMDSYGIVPQLHSVPQPPAQAPLVPRPAEPKPQPVLRPNGFAAFHHQLPLLAQLSAGMLFNKGRQEGMSRARREGLERYRAKKARRFFTKKIRYQLRKMNADKRPRINGRFVKKDQTGEVIASQASTPTHEDLAVCSGADEEDMDMIEQEE